ncbi:MAG: YfhO family protein, partial [Actinomycetota bacterium]|nr:YfhO family protein [Actinomycetota bacterium]
RWAARRNPRIAPLFVAALSLTLAGAFLVDIHPYRSFFHLRPPERMPEDARTADILASADKNLRLGTDSYGDPGFVKALLDTGWDLSVGWPHPVAGKQLWRLTTEAMSGPLGYRLNALGLSGTQYVLKQQFADGNPDAAAFALQELQRLEANPRVRPIVRAYEQAMVVRDRAVAPVLATTLARRNISVVSGGDEVTKALDGLAAAVVRSSDACGGASSADLGPGVAGEVLTACAMQRWIGTTNGTVDIGSDFTGGVFRSPAAGLRGVSVWLDRAPGTTELVLYQVAADGRSPGREVWRGTSSNTDENEMAAFVFDPIAGSAGTDYVFSLSCPRCDPSETPRMVQGRDWKAVANLVVDGAVQPGLTASFSLLYDRVGAAPDPATRLSAARPGPGRWRIEASGQRPVLLVVAETYFPGWVARVDGERVPVVEADGAFVGVPVPAGDHRVTLEYQRPAASTAGRLVTATTLLLSVALLLHPRLRRRRGSSSGGDALEVRSPPAKDRRQVPFQLAQRHPRGPATRGKGPGGERDETVLPVVGHVEAGLTHQPEKGGRREPGVDVYPVPFRMNSPAHPDNGVVLDGLGQDEVAPGTKHAPDLP